MHTLQKHTILLITILLWSCISVFASERTSPQYHYHITDHQGNIRLVANTAGTAEQVTHYYPYGLPFAESQNAHLQPYKYNSKELDMTNNLYDYGARHYDAALCRWNGMDALAEKAPSFSPYMYCFSNPIKHIDPDGNWSWENQNVRAARNSAKLYGGTFQRWEGQNGKTYASVTRTSYNADGFTISAYRFLPGTNHNVLWNIMESFDISEDQQDGANTGYINDRDFKVGFGIMGTLAGLMSFGVTGIALKPQTIISGVSVLNSCDDILTNEQGESGLQQQFPNSQDAISVAKTGISIIGLGNDMLGVMKEGQVVNIIDGANTTISTIINQVYDANYEQKR